MTLLRTAIILLGLVVLGGGFKGAQSSAQASTPINANQSARDASTSRKDIILTNSCIEAGQTKAHCICVTKVFKYQMSLREYDAAVTLYGSNLSPDPTARSATKISLRQRGYKDQEIVNINNFQSQLLDQSSLKKRCEAATSYFDQPLP